MPVLHNLDLTDGELAAVEEYRKVREIVLAGFDEYFAEAMEYAALTCDGLDPEAIACRFKRITPDRVRLVLDVPLTVAVIHFATRSPSDIPAATRDTLKRWATLNQKSRSKT